MVVSESKMDDKYHVPCRAARERAHQLQRTWNSDHSVAHATSGVAGVVAGDPS